MDLPEGVRELLEKKEVRLAKGRELVWIRLRIYTAALVIGGGSLYGAWVLIYEPVSWLTGAFLLSIPVSAVGMNLSYHAYFSHGACRTSRWLKIALGMLGALNFRGSIIEWAAHHRRHHAYTDVPHLDPHTPRQYGTDSPWKVLRGLWWVFLGEKLSPVRTVEETWAADLLRDPDVVWLDRTYELWAVLSLVLPAGVVYAWTQDPGAALAAGAVLGCLRAASAYCTIAVLINGFCHLWGARPFTARHQARNLAFLSLPTFGGSLHHNHHVFPKSLTVSLNGELDPFDLLYRFLERLGLIWDVQRPSPQTIEGKKRSASHDVLVASSNLS